MRASRWGKGLSESLGFRKIGSFYEITNFCTRKKKKTTTTATTIRINGTQSENKHGDPMFY